MTGLFRRSIAYKTASPSPASRGRRLAGLSFILLLLGLATAVAQQTEHPGTEDSPYRSAGPDPRAEARHDRFPPHRQSESLLRGHPTGLRLQPGTSVALTFGQDRYQDGATLAAIVQGLEVGERLVVERIDDGVVLRRHGGPPSRAHDFLEPHPRAREEQP